MPENAPDDWAEKDFYNIAVACETDLQPLELLEFIKQIEAKMGRDMAAKKWAPRIIDIDILKYHDEIIDAPHLKIPHPEMEKRDFVMVPLGEILANTDAGLSRPVQSGIRSDRDAELVRGEN